MPKEDWKKKVRNFCYNRADILVCQTPLAVELLEKQYGVNCRKVIIPNPISANLPSWKGEESKEIITAARLTEQKNLPLLIDAFAKLNVEHPDYHLTIYGEGEQRHFLSQYIEKKELVDYVSMPGFATDIHSIMSNAYMYVSSSDYEGISNSMLEAMGIGLPCVCTDCPVGGAAMVIKNGVSGILTKVGSVEDLYKGMKTLVDDKELHKKISKSNYNDILRSRFANRVNAHKRSQFIYRTAADTNWNNMSYSQKKQALLDSYDSFSYDKY